MSELRSLSLKGTPIAANNTKIMLYDVPVAEADTRSEKVADGYTLHSGFGSC
jgi:hypothetical protein